MTSPPPKRRYEKYDDIIWNVERSACERRRLPIGRRGALVTPRRFHLSEKRLAELRKACRRLKRFPNPHKKGFVFYLVEALVGLGVNKKHALESVIERVRQLMSDASTVRSRNSSTAWDRWVTDMPRFEKLDNDWRARFEMNVCTLQRLGGFTPYGRKLLEVGQKVMKSKGAVIDILRANDGDKLLRLNTNSNRPRNDFKSRGHGSASEREAHRRAQRMPRRRKDTAASAQWGSHSGSRSGPERQQ
jgi:hypothetical protein